MRKAFFLNNSPKFAENMFLCVYFKDGNYRAVFVCVIYHGMPTK
jgi:hypothetical protein